MYRALYRKWRPQRFADVVGQQPIVTALQNQIAAGRIGHAYLFTGTRGTGKTTCAKIFAKAVNCLDTTSPDPCCACEICKGIDSGSIMDIIEMDAASNNGVDDIRDLRDEVAYLPSVCRYKVYIIDEVHMLSTQAFNALLKTMEEPPEHVIFILATTEVQKVPVTILSRCQRYDFARITAQDIAGRLLYVAGQEQIDLEENAAQLIGRLADGAMRDALSILDTCAGVDNHVDEALVRRMAGVTDRGYLFEISDAIAARDSVAALGKIAELRQQSVDMRRLCMELAGHYRNLMLCALPGGTELLTGTSPEEEAAYAQRKDFPQAEAIRAINAFGQALEKMSRGTDQRIGTKFLYPGIGYGGSCFPKDVKALIRTGEEHGCDLQVLKAVEAVNNRQKEVLCDKLVHHFGDLRGKTVAVWGLAFKPNTDDVREAPALVLIEKLLAAGASVRAFDPVARDEAERTLRRLLGDLGEKDLRWAESIYDAALEADAVLLVTEWKEFRMPNWPLVRKAMRGNLVLDGRNIYDKAELSTLGFIYEGIGN